MASKLEIMRDKLDKKLFNNDAVLKSTITHFTYNEGADSFGGYSDADPTYTNETTYSAVPYNTVPKKFGIQSFGDIQTGDSFVVVRYDKPLSTKDKVEMNNNTYFVQEVKEIIMNDGIAVKIAQVRLQH